MLFESGHCSKDSDISNLSLPIFGLAFNKFKFSVWDPNGDSEGQKANSLLRAADNWLRQLQVNHPDYNFFVSHYSYCRWAEFSLNWSSWYTVIFFAGVLKIIDTVSVLKGLFFCFQRGCKSFNLQFLLFCRKDQICLWKMYISHGTHFVPSCVQTMTYIIIILSRHPYCEM